MHVIQMFVQSSWKKKAIGRDLDFGYQLVVFEQAKEWTFPFSWRIGNLIACSRYLEGIEQDLEAIVDVAAAFDQIARLVAPQK